jgi:hypothetical protein
MSNDGDAAAIAYYRTLNAVRDSASLIIAHPEHLKNFDLHLERLPDVIDAIIALIHRDYPNPQAVPFHSRWRHFEAVPPATPTTTTTTAPSTSTTSTSPQDPNEKPPTRIPRLDPLLSSWTSEGVDPIEQVRRLVDLFVVSVLLDAGAGNQWKYVSPRDPTKASYVRSEGLAIASLDWFLDGGFSSDPVNHPYRVDAVGLKDGVTLDALQKAFQVSKDGEGNPLVGAEGRCDLLRRLGLVCESHPEFFSISHILKNSNSNSSSSSSPSSVVVDTPPRPGYLVDFLLHHPSTKTTEKQYLVPISTLWQVVMEGLSGVWPATRTKLDGVSLGDVWPSKAMESIIESNAAHGPGGFGKCFVAFHKLSQWLTYSLMEPLNLLGVKFEGVEVMTGLAEYRNGGLFVDMGVITLKKDLVGVKRKQSQENTAVPPLSTTPTVGATSGFIPKFEVFDDAVIEWRSLTVGLLDLVGKGVRERLGMTEEELPLVKVLEAGKCASLVSSSSS